MSRLIVAANEFAQLVPPTVIRRRRGQTFQVKVSESILRQYEATKHRLCMITATNPSQSIVVRRALDLYLRQVSRLSDEQVKEEVQHLLKHRE